MLHQGHVNGDFLGALGLTSVYLHYFYQRVQQGGVNQVTVGGELVGDFVAVLVLRLEESAEEVNGRLVVRVKFI